MLFRLLLKVKPPSLGGDLDGTGRKAELLLSLTRISVPGQRETKDSTKDSANNTWHRFRFQHTVPLPGPDAKAGRGRLPWRWYRAQGMSGRESTDQEGQPYQ